MSVLTKGLDFVSQPNNVLMSQSLLDCLSLELLSQLLLHGYCLSSSVHVSGSTIPEKPCCEECLMRIMPCCG